MSVTLEQLQAWMNAKEDEHLEFKKAENRYDFGELVRYCAALANEGGGSIVLGVTDKRPRQVTGTQAFDPIERTKAGLIQKLRMRIEADELQHPNGRVLVFTSPPRPLGMPIPVDGAYWMRGGEDLLPMTPDMLRRIFDEAGPDYSAEISPNATLNDLDPRAIEEFRQRWVRKSGNQAILQLPPEQLLRDAELVIGIGVTIAALVLLGTRPALGRLLAQAEVIYEYRSGEAAGPAAQREEFREGFLLYYDRLWELVNRRNDLQHFQDGLFMLDVPTFSEGAVREAVLNAIAHRDYRQAGSVFIRQYPRRIEITSPGGFPPGVSAETILDRQLPRNRRIAEAFARCGLVERAGQGANRMFEEAVQQSKALPDYSRSDAHQVWLTLDGEVQDPKFLQFLQKLGNERTIDFATADWLVLGLVARGEKLAPALRATGERLLEMGILERAGRGKLLLSRQYYSFIGKRGVYTRKKGLDRDTNKALLLKHIQANAAEGSPLKDLLDVLPGLSRFQVQTLVKELKEAGEIQVSGATRAGKWFPAPPKP